MDGEPGEDGEVGDIGMIGDTVRLSRKQILVVMKYTG